MKNTFTISYNNNSVIVEKTGEQGDHTEYTVFLPDGNLQLRRTEDDEGAGRWINIQTNNETEVSAEIGLLIELHNVQFHEG
jgi:hypothetical protein